jgi:hypothetical protein
MVLGSVLPSVSPIDFSGYVKREDFTGYVTVDDLANYAKTRDLSEYVKTDSFAEYVEGIAVVEEGDEAPEYALLKDLKSEVYKRNTQYVLHDDMNLYVHNATLVGRYGVMITRNQEIRREFSETIARAYERFASITNRLDGYYDEMDKYLIERLVFWRNNPP